MEKTLAIHILLLTINLTDCHLSLLSLCPPLLLEQDIEDLDHYEMKEEEPVDGKKSEDDGIEKENLAILEKIRKNQRQDHLNVSAHSVRKSFSTFLGSRETGCISSILSVDCVCVCVCLLAG